MGNLLLLIFVVLGSAQDVYFGSLFQNMDPFFVALYTFLIAIVFFLMIKLSSLPDLSRRVLCHWKDFLKLNILTASNWLSFFVALKYIEPAVVGAVAFALMPSISTLIGPWLRPQFKISRAEYISAAGVTLGLGILIAATLTKTSSLVNINLSSALLGMFFSTVAAAGMTVNTFVTKKISEAKFRASEVLTFRFIGVIFISGLFILILKPPTPFINATLEKQMVLISIFAVIIPQYFMQRGIELVEPMVAALLMSLTPVVTFTLEIFDSRLKLSSMTFAGIFISTAFSIYGTRQAESKERAE